MKNYKDEDYIHYVYKITNKTTGRYYIGIHSFPKDLGYTPLTDGYWGSGSEITKDIRNLGRDNFTKEIIGIYSTREEISNEEQKLVTIEVVRSKDSYNLTIRVTDPNKKSIDISMKSNTTNKKVEKVSVDKAVDVSKLSAKEQEKMNANVEKVFKSSVLFGSFMQDSPME